LTLSPILTECLSICVLTVMGWRALAAKQKNGFSNVNMIAETIMFICVMRCALCALRCALCALRCALCALRYAFGVMRCAFNAKRTTHYAQRKTHDASTHSA
jgi:hypothetical protein